MQSAVLRMKTAGWRVERLGPVHLGGCTWWDVAAAGAWRKWQGASHERLCEEVPGEARQGPASCSGASLTPGGHLTLWGWTASPWKRPYGEKCSEAWGSVPSKMYGLQEKSAGTNRRNKKYHWWGKRREKGAIWKAEEAVCPEREEMVSVVLVSIAVRLGSQAQGEVHLLLPLSSGQGSGHSLSQIRSPWGGIFHMWSLGGHDSVRSRHTAWGNYVIKKLLKSFKWQQNIILNVRNTFF